MGNKKIGTTGRGIGPVLSGQDRPHRHPGGRETRRRNPAGRKGRAALEFKNQVLVKIYNRKALDPGEVVVDRLLGQADGFKHRIADTRLLLNKALENGETVLLEGSPGHLLDVDHGTYPVCDVVRSEPGGTGGEVGIGPTRITTVLASSRRTPPRRVGPFPTELFDRSASTCRRPVARSA